MVQTKSKPVADALAGVPVGLGSHFGRWLGFGLLAGASVILNMVSDA